MLAFAHPTFCRAARRERSCQATVSLALAPRPVTQHYAMNQHRKAKPKQGVRVEETAKGSMESATAPTSSRSHTILIVEDEAFVAMEADAIVTGAGHTVVGFASTGQEAIRKATSLKPSLVLMDIRLQGPMDGIDAACAIRATQPIAIIFVTANADIAGTPRAARAKPAGIVGKPFSDASLLEAIAKI